MPKNGKKLLNEVERAVAQAKASNPATTHDELAARLDYSRQQIAKILERPHVQAEIERLQNDVWESIKRIRLKAMVKAENLVSREPQSEVQERIQADMVKEFIKPILAHPASFPASAVELPEFVDKAEDSE